MLVVVDKLFIIISIVYWVFLLGHCFAIQYFVSV